MSVSKFDYNKKYTVETIPTNVGGYTIYFMKERVQVTGTIVGDCIKCTHFSLYTMKAELESETLRQIDFDIIVPPEVLTDDITLEKSSLHGDLSKNFLAKNLKASKYILCLISPGGFVGIKPEGLIQAVISLFSILDGGKEFIRGFLDDYKDKMTVIDQTDVDTLFDLYVKGTIPANVTEEGQARRKSRAITIMNSKTLLAPYEIHHFQICLFSLVMEKKNMDNYNNFVKWMTNRRKAWEGTLSIRMGDISLPFDVVKHFRTVIQLVPTFRQLVLNVLLASKGEKGIRHILDLLAYSQMTNLKFIISFISIQEKTYAHLMKEVLEDLNVFRINLAEVKEKYGPEDWKYYKLEEPQSSYFSNKTIPALSYAAYMFAHNSERTNNYTYVDLPMCAGAIKVNVLKPLRVSASFDAEFGKFTEVFRMLNLNIEDIKRAIRVLG